jgi:hypothetical protein
MLNRRVLECLLHKPLWTDAGGILWDLSCLITVDETWIYICMQLSHQLHADFFVCYFLPWRWRWYTPPKCWFTFGIHGAISQKMVTFITTLVRTSNPTSPFHTRSNYLFTNQINIQAYTYTVRTTDCAKNQTIHKMTATNISWKTMMGGEVHRCIHYL